MAVAWVPLAAAAAAVYLVYCLVRFSRSAVDGRLRRKGFAPPDAFAGKVVWITGASQGLGAELAHAFAEHGARLILSARRRDKLQAVADACQQQGGPQHAVLPFDLKADFSALEAVAAEADTAFGGVGIDVLVHNAGCSQHSLAEETSVGVAQQMLELNTLGPIALTRAVLPRMLARRKGRLLVISSMAGKIPSPGQALYSAAKAGLNGYFAALATEVCDRGVGVTIVCPGPIATGSEASPRTVMGPEGLTTKQQETSAGGSKRLLPALVAQWALAAAFHELDEAWIALQPILALCYVMQGAPRVGTLILKRIGPKRARAIKAGGSGYDVTGMLRRRD